MRYGIPYKGSKNAIAREIVRALPAGETFVDVFAGGCAVTHAAILSGKWQRFIINDINPQPTELFMQAITGTLPDMTAFVSREEFFARKDAEPWIAACYSFGNNWHDYLYSPDIEPYKHAGHDAIYGDMTRIHALGLYPDDTMTADEPRARYTQWRRWVRENESAVRDVLRKMGGGYENTEERRGRRETLRKSCWNRRRKC